MFGVDWSDPQTLWLNITNVVLGIVTLVAVVAFVGATAVEVYERLKNRVEAVDFHVLPVPDLGVTMADGGEELDEGEDESSSGS